MTATSTSGCVNPGALQLPSPVTAHNGPIQSIEEDDNGFITPSALLTPTRPDDASQNSSSPSPTITPSISADTSQSVRASPHHSPAHVASAASPPSTAPSPYAAPAQPIDQQDHWCEQHSRAFPSEKDLRKHLISKEHRPDLYGHSDVEAPAGTNQCACGMMAAHKDNHMRHITNCGKPPKLPYRCVEGHYYVDKKEYKDHYKDKMNGCGRNLGRPSNNMT
ncbi:hypothetical protein PG991_015270 [Apiospora marii]|uniref:C2H2-type domain-containing protein n=1 Tax=Apiospora marii TaxID=335849 RepID=A0ABR1R161_9PEZI